MTVLSGGSETTEEGWGSVCVPCAGRKMAVGLCNEVWDLEGSWHSPPPHINIDKVYIVTAGERKWYSIA